MAALLAAANHTQSLAQDKPLTPPTKDEVKEGNKPTDNPAPIVPDNGSGSNSVPNAGQPLSPTTQNLVNSINTSVNLYTGTANVSIPICSLPAENINIPISLQYTAGNEIKLDYDVSNVGLGWNLQAGGMISRVLRGLSDEIPNGYAGVNNIGNKVELFLNGQMNENSRKEFHNKVLNEEWDSEADIFYFVLPTGLSGKFILKADGTPITIPYQPITIKPAIGKAATQNYWEIITQDGLRYVFGNGDYKETTRYYNNPYANSKSYISSWLINEIKNSEGTNIATFNYVPYGFRDIKNIRHTQSQFILAQPPYPSNCDNCALPSTQVVDANMHTEVIQSKFLEKITTSAGSIEFETRILCNFALSSLPCYSFYISKIKLRNNQNEIYSCKFKYGFLANTSMVKLVELQSNNAPPTKLFYNESITLPSVYSPQQDWWGYYNSNPHPTLLPSYNGGTGADRSPDEARTQAYILKKIVNPLGSVTEFEYENHRYNNNGVETIVGGLRIKSIKTKISENPNAAQTIKNYIYRMDDVSVAPSSGVLLLPLPFTTLDRYILLNCKTDNWISRNCFRSYNKQNSNPREIIGSADYIGYKVVIEKIVGNGKTVHLFSSAVEYPDVYNANYLVESQTIWNITWYEQGYRDPERSVNSFQWKRGLPLSTLVYDNNNSLKVRKNNYYNFSSKAHIRNINFFQIKIGFEPALLYSAYSDISESITLSRTEEIVYDQTPPYGGGAVGANDYLRSDVGYSYTADNQPKEVRKILPTGEVLITRTSYAKDAMTANTCLQRLQTCNQQCPTPVQLNCAEECTEQYVLCLSNFEAGMQNDEMSAALKALLAKGINAPVETTTWIQRIGEPEKLLSASLTTYKKFGNFVRAYKNYQLRVKANNLPTNVSFAAAKINAYSGVFEHDAQYELLETNEYNSTNGLATENKPNNGQPSAIVYDYLKTPIAKVANAKANQVFFTSFEEANVSFPTPANTARTGSEAWDSATRGQYAFNSFNMPVQDQSIRYELSYWTKGNTGEWVLFSTELNYTNLIAHQFPSAWIDDVRVHPVGALMTSTTYKPLIGKTSETDANNRTVYYEYDNLHRLKYVKDEKQNILEVYKYNLVR
jgi:hypothetical protein